MKKDKARDIARGVLPSTARKSARDNKRHFHATQRHAQRRVNHTIARHLADVDESGNLYTDPDLYDDFEDRDIIDGYHATTAVRTGWWGGMDEIVSLRRGADKLGPLISWATATEKNKMSGWSVEDKIAYFKAVLPGSLQGRHALGHVKDALGLSTDPFDYDYRYNRPGPYTKEKFRADLARHLASTKGRVALREYLHETVPVAAHRSETNNKVLSRVQAVDENGAPRFISGIHNVTGRQGHVPIMVDVYVPQVVAVTCDDCSFLRNDPLATTEAVNHFVEVVWTGRYRFNSVYRLIDRPNDGHSFLREILDYINSNIV